MKIHQIFKPLFLITSLTIFTVFSTHAQRTRGDVGIGIQAGQPTGFSLMVYNPRAMSFDLLAAWDLDDYYFVNIHGLFISHLDRSGIVHLMYGPGGYAGIKDVAEGGKDVVEAGISGSLGLGFMIGKLELYGRVTPRLRLTNSTDLDVGGGVGFRIFF